MRHHVRDCQGMIKTWDIRARKCVASFANDECGRPISHLALPPREACASYYVVPRRAVPRRGVLRRSAACCGMLRCASGTRDRHHRTRHPSSSTQGCTLYQAPDVLGLRMGGCGRRLLCRHSGFHPLYYVAGTNILAVYIAHFAPLFVQTTTRRHTSPSTRTTTVSRTRTSVVRP